MYFFSVLETAISQDLENLRFPCLHSKSFKDLISPPPQKNSNGYIFSNANSYDLHLILQAVATLKKTKPELMKKTQLKIIPKNTQKLRSLVVGIYEFKGIQFLL